MQDRMPGKVKTKEEVLKAFKDALQHKKDALERTERQFAKEGIKGKVISI